MPVPALTPRSEKEGAKGSISQYSRLMAVVRGRAKKPRIEAIIGLSRLRPVTSRTVRALVLALRDLDPDIRAEAAAAIGCIGPPAVEAVPALLFTARGDRKSRVRAEAVRAVGSIRAWTPATERALESVLRDDSHAVVLAARWALRSIQPKWRTRPSLNDWGGRSDALGG
jgi:hypothetical protein